MSVSRKLMKLDIHGLHALFSDSRNDVVVLNEIKAELDSRWTRAAKSLNKEVIDQINLLSNTKGSIVSISNINTNKSKKVDITKVGWLHPQDLSGSYEGFNNSSMEHFGDPLNGFAREMTQNSLDAVRDHDKPVVIDLKLHEVPIQDIPNVDELKDNLELAIITYLDMNDNPDPKVKKFFTKARSLLEKRTLKVFEFSDHNTNGMTTDSSSEKQLNNTFYVYMQTRDFSQKPEDGLGSFGIGKSAPYAVSDLRTIFTSSVSHSKENYFTQATQGKSILITLRDKDEDGHYIYRSNQGYWGVKSIPPLRIDGYVSDLSPYFQRVNTSEINKTDLGSKISILGFSKHKDWQERMAYSIVQSFFAAIDAGKLIVNIGNNTEYILNSTSIQNIKSYIDPEIAKSYDEEFNDNLDVRLNYLEAISGESISIEKDLKNLGKCRINITVSPGLPKKVCFIRSGMFITDDLPVAKLRKFSEFNDFVVVFQCINPKGNKLLRDMEPPAHNTFETARLKDRAYKGKVALNEVASWIRDALKTHAYNQVEKTSFVNELEEFFSHNTVENEGESINEINPYGDITIKLKPAPRPPVKKKKVVMNNEGEDEVEDIDPEGEFGQAKVVEHGPGPGPGPGPNPVPGPEDNIAEVSLKKINRMKPVNIRNFRFAKQKDNSVRLFFDYSKSKKLRIDVFLSGSDEDLRLNILSSNEGDIEDGALILDVISNHRNCIDVNLNTYSYGALKVEANEI